MTKKTRHAHQNQSSFTVAFRQRLFGRKHTPKAVFRDLQMHAQLKDLRAVSRLLENDSNPFHRFLFGTTFPTSYAQVRSSHFFAFTDDLEKEINWLTVALVRYAPDISHFRVLAIRFENAFLVANYDEAEGLLNEIEKTTGLSLWGMEQRFLLCEHLRGLEANKAFLSSINKDNGCDPILRFLANYISMRSEAKLSPENYLVTLRRALDLGPEYEHLCAYLRFRLEGVGFDVLSGATKILFFEGASPIVDRYMTYLSVCHAVLSHGTAEQKAIVIPSLALVGRCIRDPLLNPSLLLINPEDSSLIDESSLKILQVLDAYTEGRYEQSLALSTSLLQSCPSAYEIYYTYLHSRGYLGLSFESPFRTGSVADRALQSLDNLLRKVDEGRRSADMVLKVSLSLGRTPLSTAMYGVYRRETTSGAGLFAKLPHINSYVVNPRLALLYQDRPTAQKYLTTLARGTSSTVAFLQNTFAAEDGQNPQLPLATGIPDTRRMRYMASLHMATGEYMAAIQLLRRLHDDLQAGRIVGGYLMHDEVCTDLLICHLKAGDLKECCDLVARVYTRTPYLVRRLPLDILVSAVERTRHPDALRSVSYPIVCHLHFKHPRPIYVAYDNFLAAYGVKTPTQLRMLADEFPSDLLSIFLDRVCAMDVLACSYHFAGTQELENERIRLCQHLAERDAANAKRYCDEISDITYRSLIRKGIKQIEESKIYVDEKGIRASGRSLLEESFGRLRELSSLSGSEGFRLLDTTKLVLYHLGENGQVVERPINAADLAVEDTKIVHTSHYVLFKELFLDIRDRFISSSAHGLDAYLSVRIRHGVLQNQMRSPFEALHLICQKDKRTGIYLRNAYWDERLQAVDKSVRDQLQDILARFSGYIDQLTTAVNKTSIQVSTEKRPNDGLFDYSFSYDQLFSLFLHQFMEIASYDAFMDAVFRVLWERTRQNLDMVRRRIAVEIKDEVYGAVERAQTEIRQLVDHRSAPELLANLATCQTQVQYELEKIAQWFNISGATVLKAFCVEEVIDIAVATINNIYPHWHLRPLVHSRCRTSFAGEHFLHFFDILRTLLDNILVHSGMRPEETGVNICVDGGDSSLTLKVGNKISREVRGSDPVARLRAQHSNVSTGSIGDVAAKEGGSGLLKIRKIVEVDLRRVDWAISFDYEGEDTFAVTLRMAIGGLTCEATAD